MLSRPECGTVGKNNTLAWPLWATNFVLQVADGELPSSGAWTNLAVKAGVSNNECMTTLPVGSKAEFYRLSRP